MAPTRKGSSSHYKFSLDLDDEDYDEQKVNTLKCLRARWPTRCELKDTRQGREEVAKCIQPLFSKYLTGRDVQARKMSKVRTRYIDWAFAINAWSRDEKRRNTHSVDGGMMMEDHPATNTGAEIPQLSLTERIARTPGTPPSTRLIQPTSSQLHTPVQGSATSARDESHTPTRASKTASKSPNTPSATIDWADLEIAVDASAVGVGMIWLPMVDFEPGVSESSHGNNFTFENLVANFQKETGKPFASSSFEFVYEGFVITNSAGYKIVLKRFARSGTEVGNVLQLRIQPKARAKMTTETQLEDDVMVIGESREVGPKHRRIKPSSDGDESVYAYESEDTDMEELLPRLVVSQSPAKRKKTSASKHRE